MPGLSISFPAGRALAWWRLQPEWRPDFLSILVPHGTIAATCCIRFSTGMVHPCPPSKPYQRTNKQHNWLRLDKLRATQRNRTCVTQATKLDLMLARLARRKELLLDCGLPSLRFWPSSLGIRPIQNAKKVAVLTATQADSHLHLPHLEAFEYPSLSESLSNK